MVTTLGCSPGLMDMNARPTSEGERRLVRATGVLSRRGAFGVVLLARDGVRPVTLAGSGEHLWDFLSIPRTESEVVEALSLEYTTERETVAADIAPVLAQLTELALVQVLP